MLLIKSLLSLLLVFVDADVDAAVGGVGAHSELVALALQSLLLLKVLGLGPLLLKLVLWATLVSIALNLLFEANIWRNFHALHGFTVRERAIGLIELSVRLWVLLEVDALGIDLAWLHGILLIG